MRKTICFIISTLLLLTFVPTQAKADQSAAAYCVITPQSTAVIRESNADEAIGVAGLSKMPAILTLCMAVDKGLLSETVTVTVSKTATTVGGPSAYLKYGEQIRAEELLRASVMISAGDAIRALSDEAFGSEDVFLQNIELTLKEAGLMHKMQQTLGTNEQFTMREIAMIGACALQSPTFLKYCKETYHLLLHPDGRTTELANANKLLNTLPGCIGLLTGSSKTDGYCGVFACKRKDTVYLCAIAGCANSKSRFDLATQLFEEAFANYSVYALATADEPIIEAYPVDGGDAETVNLVTKESVSLLLNKSDGEPNLTFQLPDTLSAPLDPEFSIGTVSFTDRNGTLLYELALYPQTIIKATGYREILKRIVTIYRNG